MTICYDLPFLFSLAGPCVTQHWPRGTMPEFAAGSERKSVQHRPRTVIEPEPEDTTSEKEGSGSDQESSWEEKTELEMRRYPFFCPGGCEVPASPLPLWRSQLSVGKWFPGHSKPIWRAAAAQTHSRKEQRKPRGGVWSGD